MTGATSLVALLLATTTAPHLPPPALTPDEPPELGWLDIDELANVRVLIVSRAERAAYVCPAAVTVMPAGEIRSTGATTLPEALRWVPGLNVARMGGDTWAIGARGFQWEYATKLLVMIDGRSTYDPTEGGVRWGDHSTMLEDVERIEVVRGPGSSTWGANAVNGVINVVTKSAFDTVGTLVSTGVGNEVPGVAAVRYGSSLGERAAFRLFGQARRLADNVDAAGVSADDSTRFGQAGFRLDWKTRGSSEFTMQGGAFSHPGQYIRTISTLSAPGYSVVNDRDNRGTGAHLLGRWGRQWAGGARIDAQGYWDWQRAVDPLNRITLRVADLDVVVRNDLGERHHMTSGMGYRLTDADLSEKLWVFDPDKPRRERWSVFVQDEIALSPERWTLTIGTKLEHHDPSGWEPQPSARLSWTPASGPVVWGAVSRAIRAPTLLETNAASDLFVYPPGVYDPNLPAALRLIGNPRIETEKLMAYEIGTRWKAGNHTRVDVSGFYYDYDDYILVTGGAVRSQPSPPAIIVEHQFSNGITGDSYGGEIVVRHDPATWLRLEGSYSYVQIQLDTDLTDPFDYEEDEFTTPDHTFRIRSLVKMGSRWELGLAGRYVDEVPYYTVSSYHDLDARLAWRPADNLEVSLTGSSLLHNDHQEYDYAVWRHPTRIQRSVILGLRWTQ